MSDDAKRTAWDTAQRYLESPDLPDQVLIKRNDLRELLEEARRRGAASQTHLPAATLDGEVRWLDVNALVDHAYARGVEDAAKVCEERADWPDVVRPQEVEREADACAGAIRALIEKEG